MHNQDHAHSLLATLTFRGSPSAVEELDPSTGKSLSRVVTLLQ